MPVLEQFEWDFSSSRYKLCAVSGHRFETAPMSLIFAFIENKTATMDMVANPDSTFHSLKIHTLVLTSALNRLRFLGTIIGGARGLPADMLGEYSET